MCRELLRPFQGELGFQGQSGAESLNLPALHRPRPNAAPEADSALNASGEIALLRDGDVVGPATGPGRDENLPLDPPGWYAGAGSRDRRPLPCRAL